MLSFVLLLLLISGAEAAFYGAAFSVSVGDLQSDGYLSTLEYRLSSSSCEEFDSLFCGGDCRGYPVYLIDESRGEWCQKVHSPSFSLYPSILTIYDSVFSATNWTENRNGIGSSRIRWHFDWRIRSDINKPGSSPQTTIIPLVRVPSNCQRNINLLVSDPDGDDVRCRYAAGSECFTCTPPSVLSVSSSCSLSFSPTISSDEGLYAVQMMMEDFPRQNITLTDRYTSVQSVMTPSNPMYKISLQFVFRVDPAAPSCTAGEYLPRFLPPTPEHGAQIHTNVSETLEISVRAEATQAEITELLFSGPPGVTKSSSGSGNFRLTWTPIDSGRGLKKTLCFVVQANSSGSVYQSDLRCVFVTDGESPPTVSPPIVAATTITPSMTTPLFTTTPPPLQLHQLQLHYYNSTSYTYNYNSTSYNSTNYTSPNYNSTSYTYNSYTSTSYTSTNYTSPSYNSTNYTSTSYTYNSYNSTGYTYNGYNSTKYNSTNYNSPSYTYNSYTSTKYNSTKYNSTSYTYNSYTSTSYNSTSYTSISFTYNRYTYNSYNSTNYTSTSYTYNGYTSTKYNSTSYTYNSYNSISYTSTSYTYNSYTSTNYTSTNYTSTNYNSTSYTSTSYTSNNYTSTSYKYNSYNSTSYTYNRVPSNCQRNINLLVSDPDGDDVRCRYAADPECNTCTPPSVLNVSS
ncbi:probable inactive serine/threonine-protein kinase scy2, partial [Poecilia latipinna]|uniref:probable inactive serine/threonine-protein kinase scy2 n=1 Tax=Poecilia latipinna TaxID=48699 RepID=UPI00072EBA86